jgi:hypothetical protein
VRAVPKILASVLILGVLGTLATTHALAAFDDQASNAGRRFEQVQASLRSNQGGSATLHLPEGGPGDTATSYVVVRSGLPASVELFGTTGGTGLDRYLQLTVTRGSGREGGFVPQAVVYRGTLAGFPDSSASAIPDPGGTWVKGEAHTYRFHVRLVGGNAAQGLTAQQSFEWAAVAV